MARQANSANLKRDEEGPAYADAISLIRGKIRANQSDASSIGQDNSTLFQRIDKEMGVHPGAAKTFGAIDKMQADKRTDYIRSLLGLLNHAGYDNFDDLVDRAQKPRPNGTIVEPTADKGKAATPAKAPDALEGEGAAERVDLKTGMVVREDGTDVRTATPEELAAERERVADFDNDGKTGGQVHPFPARKH